MYKIIKNVIESRNYELADMLTKIDTLWVQGSITEAERVELIGLARQNAEVQQSIDILTKLEELDKRVKANEEAIKQLINGGNEGTEGGDGENIVYPSYVVGKWYYNGDIVMFEDTAYKCIAPKGQVCTWSPANYPDYWEKQI